MARKKRTSELLAQVSKRFARMYGYEREQIARRFVEDCVALEFFDGTSIENLVDQSERQWPRTQSRVEKAIRNHVERRDRKVGR